MSNLLHITAIFDLASLVHGTRVDDTSQGTNGWFPFERSASVFEKSACAVTQAEQLHYCLIDPQFRLFHAMGSPETRWIPEEFTDVFSVIKLIDPRRDIVLDFFSQIACAITFNEDLHLCVIDKAGDLWHTVRRAPNSQWLPFGNVQAEISSGPEIRPLHHVACATTQGGNLHVCVVNDTGGLFHTIRFSDTHPDPSLRGVWQNSWDRVYLPGNLSSSILSDGPDIGQIQRVACAANQHGELHVCVVTKAGGLFHTFRHSNADPFSQAVWQPSFGDIRSEATKSVLDSIDITRPITIRVQQDSPQGKSLQLGIEKTGETKARITQGDEIVELSDIVVSVSQNTAAIRAITNRDLGGIDIKVEIVISLNCEQSIIGIKANAAGSEVKNDQFFVTSDECDRLLAYVMKAFNAFDQNELPTFIAFGGVACAIAPVGTADLHVCGVTAAQGQKTDGQLWHTIRQGNGKWLAFGNVLTILNTLGSVINLSLSHSPHTITTTEPAIPPKRVVISARDTFFNTGIRLMKGTRFSILATGQWSNGGNPPTFVGPGGFEGLSFPGSILESANFASLLGKIGDMIFSVGETFDGESQVSGELLLGMNDVPGTFDDNLGELDIRVFVNNGS